MQFTVRISAALPEQNYDRIDHFETVTVESPAQLDIIVPRLLMAVGQAGIVQKTLDHGWKLIPARSLSSVRATISTVRVAEPGEPR